MIDTGETTQTGGRLKRVSEYIDGDFCMTYVDGVGSLEINGTQINAFVENLKVMVGASTVVFCLKP